MGKKAKHERKKRSEGEEAEYIGFHWDGALAKVAEHHGHQQEKPEESAVKRKKGERVSGAELVGGADCLVGSQYLLRRM